MSRIGLIRLGGLAAIVGSVIFAVLQSLGLRVSSLRWTTVLFLLSMMAVIVALHLLQREWERYALAGASVSVATLVGVALMAVGYILVDFVISLEGLGTLLFLVGALVATIGIIGLAVFTLTVGVLPWWSGVALIAGNPLLALFSNPNFLIFYWANPDIWYWLVASPWIVVGLGVFLAARRRAEQPSRVR